MSETIQLKRPVEFRLPQVPNYIIHVTAPGRRQDGFTEAPKTDIADLSDDELRAIGGAWLTELLNAANRRRIARNQP